MPTPCGKNTTSARVTQRLVRGSDTSHIVGYRLKAISALNRATCYYKYGTHNGSYKDRTENVAALRSKPEHRA